MAEFLFNAFSIGVSRSAISRVLKCYGYFKKKPLVIAAQWNGYLRDDYMRRMMKYQLEQLIFLDETACAEHEANHVRTMDCDYGSTSTEGAGKLFSVVDLHVDGLAHLYDRP